VVWGETAEGDGLRAIGIGGGTKKGVERWFKNYSSVVKAFFYKEGTKRKDGNSPKAGNSGLKRRGISIKDNMVGEALNHGYYKGDSVQRPAKNVV